MLPPRLKLPVLRWAFGGTAVSEHNGKKIFVSGAIPTELVLLKITEEKKDFARADVLEILNASEDRVRPPCIYFSTCGGCQWQYLSDKAQIRAKQQILHDLLKRGMGLATPKILEPLASVKTYYYRNRVRFQVSNEGRLGFFKRNSKELVSIDHCMLIDEALNDRISDAKQMAQKLEDFSSSFHREIDLRLENNKIRISCLEADRLPFSQINPLQNETLKRVVVEFLELDKSQKVLELFAGDGNFTFQILEKAASVLAIESDESAILTLEKKAKNHPRLQWQQATVAHALTALQKDRSVHFDRLLLDPPRTGVYEQISQIAHFKIPVLVYVSCDPVTLVRDLKLFSKFGYRHDCSQIVDLFPQTYHIESVTKMVLE